MIGTQSALLCVKPWCSNLDAGPALFTGRENVPLPASPLPAAPSHRSSLAQGEISLPPKSSPEHFVMKNKDPFLRTKELMLSGRQNADSKNAC